ncbi:hypothetical protein [Aliiruegeria sabulilitoris]|uniref:hypothetical protein n=1 Tax=Aliiruegeria sabulilitoris TaxID=1510458 RepID=UPI0012E379AE|nr:hypothetical protein [Aliiruegeria sabulilitoris]NDR59723.1 hypothetical protein [Pseudoruegeria sp. M32A2M]
MSDLAGTLPVQGVRRLFSRNRLGVSTKKPWVLLPLSVIAARARTQSPEQAIAVPYDMLNSGEQMAMQFLYDVLEKGSDYLFGIVDRHDTNIDLFEVSIVFLTYSDTKLRRDKLPSLVTTMAEDRSNAIPAGADIVTRFMRASPNSPIKPIQP